MYEDQRKHEHLYHTKEDTACLQACLLYTSLELIARVKAQLRRYKKYTPVQIEKHSPSILTYEKLMLNTQTYECKLNGTPVFLTPTEFSILRILLERQGTVVTLEDLFHLVWKDEYYSKNSSTITVHVLSLIHI